VDGLVTDIISNQSRHHPFTLSVAVDGVMANDVIGKIDQYVVDLTDPQK
jgi:hypothetical protein